MSETLHCERDTLVVNLTEGSVSIETQDGQVRLVDPDTPICLVSLPTQVRPPLDR